MLWRGRKLDGRALSSCTETESVMPVDMQEALSLSTLLMRTPVIVDEVLWYKVERRGSVLCFTVPVLLHHVSEPGVVPECRTVFSTTYRLSKLWSVSLFSVSERGFSFVNLFSSRLGLSQYRLELMVSVARWMWTVFYQLVL